MKMPTITLQSPLDQPRGRKRLLDCLRADLASGEYNSLKIIVAFAKIGPFRKLQQELETWAEKGNETLAVIGLDENGTSYEALKFALSNLNKTYVVHGKSSFNSTFHPKIFYFRGPHMEKVYIGSNNWTVGGTETNSESYTCITLDEEQDRDITVQLQQIWKDSLGIGVELDEELLNQLKESGLALEERTLRNVRLKSHISIAETERNLDSRPEFPKIRVVTASHGPRSETQLTLGGDWKAYGEFLTSNSASNTNLYWNVSKKNNHLNVHLWALAHLADRSERFASGEELSHYLKNKSIEYFPDTTMEGTRALLFSKLIGLLKSYWPFEVSDAFNALHYPAQSLEDEQMNQTIISNQLEKFYFWNDFFSVTNRHLGRGGRTRTPELFHLYPFFFIYDLIVTLNSMGYKDNSLTRFEINAFASYARTNGEVQPVAERIKQFRESTDPDGLEDYLREKITEMDSRFFATLQYSKYFHFDPEIIAIKPDLYNEVKEKVQAFNHLRSSGGLIEFSRERSDTYRDLLFSAASLIEYHSTM